MVLVESLTELVISQVESIPQLKRNQALADKVQADMAGFVLQKVKKEGAFFSAYHLALLQKAAKEKFQDEGRYLSSGFLLERNQYFQELRGGITRLRDMTLANAVKYHPQNTSHGAVVLRDAGEAKIRHFKLVYADLRKLGKYLASICDSDVEKSGRKRIFFKPEYEGVFSVDEIRIPKGL